MSFGPAYDDDDFDASLEEVSLMERLQPVLRTCSMSSFAGVALYDIYTTSGSRRRLLTDVQARLTATLGQFVQVEGHPTRGSIADYKLYDCLTRSFRSIYDRSSRTALNLPESLIDDSGSFCPDASLTHSRAFSDLMALCSLELAFVSVVCNRLDINNILEVAPQDLVGFKTFTAWQAFVTKLNELYPGSLPECPLGPTSSLLRLWRFYQKRTAAQLRESYFYVKLPGTKDLASKMLVEATVGLRRATMMQRLTNEVQRCHAAGWYIAFDTLTFSDDGLARFLSKPNSMKIYFEQVGDAVREAEAFHRLSFRGSHHPVAQVRSDCFRYFCVPELGSKTQRLHFHVVYLMRTLPLNAVDPNRFLPQPRLRETKMFDRFWSHFGFTSCYPVRCVDDAWSRADWKWPVNKEGVPYPCKPVVASAYYVAKYVNKHCDTSLQLNGVGSLKCSEELMLQINQLGRQRFNVRMSRRFGDMDLNFSSLDLEELVSLVNLVPKTLQFPLLVKRNVRRELRRRLLSLPLVTLLAASPEPVQLLKALRRSMQLTPEFNGLSSILTAVPKCSLMDTSDAVRNFIRSNSLSYVAPTHQSGRLPGAR